MAAGVRLAIILGTTGDLERAAALALAARRRGLVVGLFGMHDGVRAMAAAAATMATLVDEGCDVTVCVTSGDRDGVDHAALARAGVTLGGQDDHAAVVHRAGKVVAFT